MRMDYMELGTKWLSH